MGFGLVSKNSHSFASEQLNFTTTAATLMWSPMLELIYFIFIFQKSVKP